MHASFPWEYELIIKYSGRKTINKAMKFVSAENGIRLKVSKTF